MFAAGQNLTEDVCEGVGGARSDADEGKLLKLQFHGSLLPSVDPVVAAEAPPSDSLCFCHIYNPAMIQFFLKGGAGVEECVSVCLLAHLPEKEKSTRDKYFQAACCKYSGKQSCCLDDIQIIIFFA